MKRILSVTLVLLMLFSVSLTVFAAEDDKTIDVYAKYEDSTEGIYRSEIADGSATVDVGNVTISVSGVPNTAKIKILEIFPVPASETDALNWMGGKISEHGTLSHAYIITLVDANGNKTSVSGVSVTISCVHCSGDEIVIGLNTDGTATVIDANNGSFTANGNAYYVVAEKKTSNNIDTPPVVDPNTPGGEPTEPNEPNLGFLWWLIPTSLITLGGGGFAIYWFVIKKKTWADLIAVFKKKKENEE